MAHKSNVKKYKNFYANLLHMYPVSYRERFAEPMLQTFTDLCHERERSGDSLFAFAAGTYVETFAEIVKEHVKGVIMSSKVTKIKIFTGVAGVAVLASVTAFAIWGNRPPVAQSISPLSSLDQVRELSKGEKDACLMDSQQAVDAVKKDDRTITFGEEEISNFEMAASSAIMDVPAGTEYKLTIHSYEDGVVKGAMAYEYGYGIYNYTIKKLSKVGEWELVSTVACERS